MGAKVNARDRFLVLISAFLGWLLAGSIMSLGPLAGRSAIKDLLPGADETDVVGWFAVIISAFLLGAAAGGLLFGWLGDRLGRARAMGLSILWYSVFTGVTYLATDVYSLTILRFVACMGVGGMWPNGVALTSEVWSNVSRPLLSGLIGTAANLGFMLASGLTTVFPISTENWQSVFLAASLPALLGLFVLAFVPESAGWKAQQQTSKDSGSSVAEVFRPPLLRLTLLGICLGAIPLLGNWGGANWLVPWAGQVGESGRSRDSEAEPAAETAAAPRQVDLRLKSRTQFYKSSGAAVGALLGGWLASQLGRRSTYFLISLLSLATSSYIFWFLDPLDPHFLGWVAAIGFFGTVYFGWLPLYLPELFPQRVRATGTGVTFNFGRILTAVAVLMVGQFNLIVAGNYAEIGRVTCLIYLVGMVLICFAPDTRRDVEF